MSIETQNPAATAAPTTLANATVPKRSRRRRLLRVVVIVVAAITALNLITAVTNAAMTRSEKASAVPYGRAVALEGGTVNVVRNGGTGPVLVLLSGYGTAAPGLDFAPLVRELGAFDVIVIEGFGYGLADTDVTDRTVENITSEIHETLQRLGVTGPIILGGHSVGGIYAHYYANAYPGEVSALIGIDPTPATASTLEVGTPSRIESTLRTLGTVRVASTLMPSLVTPPGDAFTADELQRIVRMTNWNYGNASVADEWAHLAANSTTTAAEPIPADIPTLQFLSTESLKNIPGWLDKHEAELAGVTAHELVTVEGAHYLHWTQAPLLAQAITQFVDANVAN